MRTPSPWRRVVLAAALFSIVTAWLLVRIDDYDIWFHMLIGREVLRTGGIPSAEFYKYPLLGQPGGFHEWGFGVLAELTRRTGGWLGLAILNAAVSAGAVLLVVVAALRRGASRSAVVLLVGPLAIAASTRFGYRPEMMLYLALGATLLSLEAKRWAVLPALTLGLALFHPSPLILLLVAGAYAVDVAIEERRPTRRLGVVVGLLMASALAVALAPYGLHQLTLPIEFTLRGDLTKMIAEFAPAMQTPLRYHVIAVAIVAACGVAFARPRRASDVLLVVVFGYLAFAHIRNAALFALLVFGPAAVALTRGLGRLSSRARFGAAGIALVAVTFAFFISPAWGVGIDVHSFPRATADFILAHRPAGRMINDLRNGGYLAWRLYPDYLVSVDGRTYYGQDLPMQISDRVLQGEPGWREIVARYDVTMVATWPVNFSSGDLSRGIAELDRDPAWMLVVAEPAGMLFVKRSVAPGALALPRGVVWTQVRDAADALAAPDKPGAYLARGTANFKLHDFGRAAADFARYSELVPSDAETAAVARQLSAAVAGDGAALQLTEAAYVRSVQPRQ